MWMQGMLTGAWRDDACSCCGFGFVSSCVLVMGWPCKKLFHFTFYILLFLLKRPECLMDSNNILLTWHRQVLSSACTLFRSAFLAVLSNQSLNAWEGECPLPLRKASSELKLTIGGKKYTPMKLLSQSNVINQFEYRASCWKLAPREWKVQMQKKVQASSEVAEKLVLAHT